MKLLNYEDELSLVKVKLECDCGYVFTVMGLESGDIVECPQCGKKFKVRVGYNFEPLEEGT